MNQPPLGKISTDGPFFLILNKPAIICGGIGIILLSILALAHGDAFFGTIFAMLGAAFILFGFSAKALRNISHTRIVVLTPQEFIIDHCYHIPLSCVIDVKYLGRYDKWGMYSGFEISISPTHPELGSSIFFLAPSWKMKTQYKSTKYFTQAIMKQVFICKKTPAPF